MVLEARYGSEITPSGPNRLLVGDPRGLCAGVERSLDAFDRALEQYPNIDLYSVGEPAHNTHINDRYRNQGVIFVGSIDQVPEGSNVALGPHSVQKEQRALAEARGLNVWDTTCPLVTKVEDEIVEYTEQGIVTIYWGDPDHQEAKAAMSYGDVILVQSMEQALSDEVFERTRGKNGVAFASQTTFNADEAIEIEDRLRKERYPDLVTPKVPDRCYATRNRQAAVKEMIAAGATCIVVVGSPESSNSRRLAEVAEKNGANAIFVDSAEELDAEALAKYEVIGFESGASVEEDVFQQVVGKVQTRYGLETESIEVADEKKIRFAQVKVVDYRPNITHVNQSLRV